jgi:hypothetical protein
MPRESLVELAARPGGGDTDGEVAQDDCVVMSGAAVAATMARLMVIISIRAAWPSPRRGELTTHREVTSRGVV